jgi:sialate O-acetylesterase
LKNHFEANEMNRKPYWVALFAVVSFQAPAALAAVHPHGLISEGMVIQQGVAVPIWGTAGEGEKVTVDFQSQHVSTTASGGKWLVRLEPSKAGGPFEMTIAGENQVRLHQVYVGEVWVCSGQSNMEWPVRLSAGGAEAVAKSTDPQLRLFVAPHRTSGKPEEQVSGAWRASGPASVTNFSAVGYFFGRDLRRTLGVPVGLIESNWGGTIIEAWMSRNALIQHPDFKDYETKAQGANPATNPNRPGVLYNGMISSLLPYAIRGVIWYQGESNAGRAVQYQTLFPGLIRDWRRAWGNDDLVFLFVQLAPFQKIRTEPRESAWAELREAQRLTSLHVPHTGMAVITDLGDEKDIHPKRKEPVAERLALAARALAYGQAITYSGPMFREMKIEGDQAILSFDHVGGGLVARGGRLEGFTIAGDDRKFVPAEAEIRGDQVVVHSGAVSRPVAVRFGWADYPVVNLWNRDGLPASPFRTDDFRLTTQPK